MLQYCGFLETIIRVSENRSRQVKVLSPFARMATQKQVKRRYCHCMLFILKKKKQERKK